MKGREATHLPALLLRKRAALRLVPKHVVKVPASRVALVKEPHEDTLERLILAQSTTGFECPEDGEKDGQ